MKELEIVVLRHELAILRRHARRPPITARDRLFLAAASRPLPRERWRSFLITPRRCFDGTGAWSRNGGPSRIRVDRRCDARFETSCSVSRETIRGGAINGLSVS